MSRRSRTEIVFLVVGHKRSVRQIDDSGTAIDGFCFISFDQISAEILNCVAPQVVLSPLFSRGFDAIDLARRLSFLGFDGAYRPVTRSLPNPSAVLAEIRAAAPTLDIDLCLMADLQRR